MLIAVNVVVVTEVVAFGCHFVISFFISVNKIKNRCTTFEYITYKIIYNIELYLIKDS